MFFPVREPRKHLLVFVTVENISKEPLQIGSAVIYPGDIRCKPGAEELVYLESFVAFVHDQVILPGAMGIAKLRSATFYQENGEIQ